MTGIRANIRRGGIMQSVELDRMTDAELEEWAAVGRGREPFAGYGWAIALAAWIRDHAREQHPAPARESGKS